MMIELYDFVLVKDSGKIGKVKRIWKKDLFTKYYDVMDLETGVYRVLRRWEFTKIR